MSRLDVIVVPDTFRLTASGAVTGQIWLRHQDATTSQDLPGPQWYDFPIPILSWWREGLALVAAGQQGELRFMDGPHCITLAPAGPADIRVCDEELVGTVSRAGLTESWRNAAQITLAECQRRGWRSKDIAELQNLLALSGAG